MKVQAKKVFEIRVVEVGHRFRFWRRPTVLLRIRDTSDVRLDKTARVGEGGATELPVELTAELRRGK